MTIPKILEIHQIEDWMLKKPKSFYEDFDILTFDDGLVSQFWHYDFFQRIDKPKIYFYSTRIVRPSLRVIPKWKVCDTAHKDACVNNDFSAYMHPAELAELSWLPKTYIGLHGHKHIYLKNLSVIQQYKTVISETEKMLDAFNRHSKMYNIHRVHEWDFFCAPYNDVSYYEKTIKKMHPKFKYTPNLTEALKHSLSNKEYHLSMFGENRIAIENFDTNNESLMPKNSEEIWLNDPTNSKCLTSLTRSRS